MDYIIFGRIVNQKNSWAVAYKLHNELKQGVFTTEKIITYMTDKRHLFCSKDHDDTNAKPVHVYRDDFVRSNKDNTVKNNLNNLPEYEFNNGKPVRVALKP